ncbi:MAG: ssDNA endonuclease and repair protein rad10 [Caeruleum heppii]|nr:MAG: ssDNA endonuclease and repair protein rad10 [Caeruleum heppii]
MDDDDFADDAAFSALAAAAERAHPAKPSPSKPTPLTTSKGVQQPKPQALPSRKAPSSILVSPRQKGNPILAAIHSVPWEYSDIPADYVLGGTTCALFLSLKYHRLHPEYIYARIRALGGKYNLRVLLAMVDIPNHEDTLKELSKTSLINNLTLVLAWSAPEAGRYLELFKSYEHANASSIRAHQATGFNEKLIEFVTVPRSINKTDAVGLVGNFGTLRQAVNARPEEVALIAGWGEKKIQRWCTTVREPFRVRRAAKRGAGLSRETTLRSLPTEASHAEDDIEDEDPETEPREPSRPPDSPLPSPPHTTDADQRPSKRARSSNFDDDDDGGGGGRADDEDEDALQAAAEMERENVNEKLRKGVTDQERTLAAVQEGEGPTSARKGKATGGDQEGMSEGMLAALARLREQG